MKKNWTYKKLGEVCDFQRGLTYSKDDEVEYSNNCVLRSNNIELSTMSVVLDELKYIREDLFIPEEKKIRPNTILICMSNGSKQHLGKVAHIGTDYGYAFGGFMGLLTPKHTIIISKYLYYCCLSAPYKHFLLNISNGANITNLKFSDLSSFPIPLPPLPIQENIVSELDCINGILDNKRQQLKELDALAQSLFYQMFGDPINNEKGWEVKKLGEVCDEKKNIKRASKCFDSFDYIHYIDISSINNTSNCIISTTSLSFAEAPSRAQQKVEKGDILISLVRPNLKNIAIVNIDEENLVASSGFCVLRATKSSNFFIKTLVLTPHFTEYLLKRVTGANYPAVREDDIRNCSIGVPPLPLQQSFASKVEAIEKQKALIKQSIADTETLLASRMQYWFD